MTDISDFPAAAALQIYLDPQLASASGESLEARNFAAVVRNTNGGNTQGNQTEGSDSLMHGVRLDQIVASTTARSDELTGANVDLLAHKISGSEVLHTTNLDSAKGAGGNSGEENRVEASAVWERCLEELRSEIDPQIFAAYIAPLAIIDIDTSSYLTPTSFDVNSSSEEGGLLEDGSLEDRLERERHNVRGGKIFLAAPSRFLCAHIERNYSRRIAKVIGDAVGSHSLQVVLKVDDKLASAAPRYPGVGSPGIGSPVIVKKILSADVRNPALRPLAASSMASDHALRDAEARSKEAQVPSNHPVSANTPALRHTSQQVGSQNGRMQPYGSIINPRYTFSTFVVGNSNQFGHAAAMRVAEQPGKSYNPLFIYGGVGLGKTHLLHAIANTVLDRNPNAHVLYMSSESFTNELIQSLRNERMNEFKNRLRSVEVLLIDDIQFLCGKERTQEEFFHTFNALYASKHQIVVTSDKLPQEIPGIEERLQTRFSWGLTADMQAPDFETRVAILKRKAFQEGIEIPEEVAHLIAERISSNVRELEGALTRLHAVSSLQNTVITLEFARSALKPLLMPKTVHLSVDDIKKSVADFFNIRISEMVSKKRTKNLSFPRHIAMYLCRKHTTCSYPEIGDHFGGRDHSSVIHAANVVASKVANDPDTRQLVSDLERRLLGS